MDLSIIIVTWNNEDTITDCLRSILENADYGVRNSIEIFVIDNDSSDRTVEKIEQFSDQHSALRIQFKKNDRNFGFARGTNQGLEKAKGRYHLLLNPDTVLMKDTLPRMVDWMDRRSDVGILAPQLLTPEGKIQPSCRKFPGYGNILWELTGIPQLIPQFSFWKMGSFDHGVEREVDQPMAACLMVRREALEGTRLISSSHQESQYLDERFPLYFNDVDLCYRIKNSQKRWKIVFSPVVQVIHHKGFSTKKMGARRIFSLHQSMIHYFKIYKMNVILFPLLAVLLIATAILRSFVSYPLSVIQLSNNRNRKPKN